MHLYKYIIISVLLFLSSCNNKKEEVIEAKPLEITNQELFNYVEYCNDRFNFCINYPSNFSAQPASANGDGKEFIHLIDDAKIIVYGELDTENVGLKPHIEFIKNQLNITDSIHLQDGFEFFGKGKKDNKAYYYRVLSKEKLEAEEPVNIVYSIQLSYPENMNKKYNKIWRGLMKTLRFNH